MANEKRLIDADSLLEKIDFRIDIQGLVGATVRDMVALTRKIITAEPTVDAVEVVHGRWLPFRVGFWTSVFECSECHRRVTLSCDEVRTFEMLNRRYPFCHCGAKMDGDMENNRQAEVIR